jgi:hypothetical protein
VDAAGNADADPATRSWSVDASPPAANFTAGPAEGALVATRAVRLAFAADEPAQYECRVDDGAFAACASPFTTHELGDGGHSVSLRATDGFGHQAQAIIRSFTVDASAPDVTITGGPADGARTNDATPTLHFGAEPGATFQCRTTGQRFGPCAGEPGTHTPMALADGVVLFEVRAVDAAGNVGEPTDRIFVIDTSRPRLSVRGPARVRTARPTARVAFRIGASEASVFTCALDRRKPARCRASYRTRPLPRGSHKLTVTATDAAGNVARTVKRFKIVAS